ncbi:hypothetical protein Hanom_Chr00s078083g01792221 [Helianthus anomalus]
MAEEQTTVATVATVETTNTTVAPPPTHDQSAAPQEMDLETLDSTTDAAANGGKRSRDEAETTESPEKATEAKKAKVDEAEKSVEEERLEKEETKTGPVSIGYKTFETSVEMYDYFFKFLHYWPPNLNINKVFGFNFDFVFTGFCDMCLID